MSLSEDTITIFANVSVCVRIIYNSDVENICLYQLFSSYIANNYINNTYIRFLNDSSVLFLSILYNAHHIARGRSRAFLYQSFPFTLNSS